MFNKILKTVSQLKLFQLVLNKKPFFILKVEEHIIIKIIKNEGTYHYIIIITTFTCNTKIRDEVMIFSQGRLIMNKKNLEVQN